MKKASADRKNSILRTSLFAAVLVGMLIFLVFSILAAVTFGNADLSLKDVYSVIAYKLFHINSLSAYGEGAVHDVVWLIRLPRVLLALGVGMALSVCGVVMQAIVQNHKLKQVKVSFGRGSVNQVLRIRSIYVQSSSKKRVRYLHIEHKEPSLAGLFQFPF